MMSDQAPEGITAHLTEAPGDPLILILVTTAGIQLDPLDALGWYSPARAGAYRRDDGPRSAGAGRRPRKEGAR
jgi:hypothetical protein